MEERIQQPTDLNASRVTYKTHVLRLSSYELTPGEWVPKAVVVLPQDEGNGKHDLHSETTFPTLAEADTEAFLMSQQWVDAKMSGHHREPDVTLP